MENPLFTNLKIFKTRILSAFIRLGCKSFLICLFFPAISPLRAQFTCASATNITDGACRTGDVSGGSFSGGFAGCNGGSTPVHFYSFTAPPNGDCVQFDITNPSVGGSWEVMIYTAGCGSYLTGSGGCVENVVAGMPLSISGQDGSGNTLLTPGSSYVLVLGTSAATTYNICFNSPADSLPSNECTSPISFGGGGNFYNGGDCNYSGSFDDATNTDPSAALLCAGSVENSQWLTFTAASNANIPLVGSGISCTGGGCGFQFGIFSAGIAGTCCGSLTSLGCYGNKVCPGGNPSAGPTNPAGRVTWSGTSTTGFTATITGVSTGEVFCFVMDGNADADCFYSLSATGILPIAIRNFEGQVIDDNISLNWTTEMEIHSSRFEILRSGNGRQFESIGEVASAGNSNTLMRYHFTDRQPKAGLNYYRLRLIDQNGSQLNSQVIRIERHAENPRLVMQGNALKIIWGENWIGQDHVSLHIMDMNGRLAYEYQFHNPQEQSLLHTPMNAGTYILCLSGEGTRFIQRIEIVE